MAMSFNIAHVEINASNFHKSCRFYQKLFYFLGYKKKYKFKDGAGWSNGISTVFIFQCDKKFLKKKFHRKAPGLNHLAFHAPSRKAVDKLHTLLLRQKVPVLYGGPKEYPHYKGGYYAVYFEDPDRIKLEFCYMRKK
ncbi:MAG: VOC family protein [Candidatus Aenigmarchaeota archaeon]|nr:VOC family protein [Candidatus Aenigmarchaeota archaeon]